MTIHIIPTLEDNYTYAIQSGADVILIDCGEAKPILQFLSKNNLTPTHLLCTHHHGDHIAGIKDLKAIFPDVTVHGPEKDRDRIPGMQIGLNDKQSMTLNTYEIQCIETSGHTKNHLCFYVPELKSVFTGDALFSMGCGRLFEGTPSDLFSSMQKLKALPDETMIYCGHEYTAKNGEFGLSIDPDNAAIKARMVQVGSLRSQNLPTIPVSLGDEKKTSLFLQADTVEKIAQLRQLRDQF